jgi:hypothetical protein
MTVCSGFEMYILLRLEKVTEIRVEYFYSGLWNEVHVRVVPVRKQEAFN